MKHVADFSEILPLIAPRATIVLHSGCAAPGYLSSELAAHAQELDHVRLLTFMLMGPAPYADRAAPGHIALSTFFPGKGLRRAVAEGRVEFMRQPLSAIPGYVASKITADILFLRLSPPDAGGRMSLGISVDYMRTVLEQKPLVVAEIDPRMPRTRGDTWVLPEQVQYVLDSRDAPQSVASEPAGEIDRRIAEHIAGLVKNGAVVQTGIGALPDLVLGRLGHLRDLGIHTGIITDAMMPLLKSGAVTNAGKSAFRGKSVTTIAAGTQALYDFLHENDSVEFHPCALTHDHAFLATIDNLCAINSVLEIDLAGQINAEEIDGRVIAGPGGLPDFVAGAARAKGGVSIIALRSMSPKADRGNIRGKLAPGAPVTASVTADRINFVVTEHGVAAVKDLSAAARAEALIGIAHPDQRADLRRALP